MPSFTEKSLLKHPGLKAFLESESPNVSLLEQPLNFEYRLIYSRNLALDNLTIFNICALLGKESHINALGLSTEERIALIKAKHYYAFRCAAEGGHPEMVQAFFDFLNADEKKEAVQSRFYQAIRFAAINGDTVSLELLLAPLNETEKKTAVKTNNYQSFNAAIGHGHTEVLECLFSPLTEMEKKEVIKAYNYRLINTAAYLGDITTVQTLLGYLSAEEKIGAVKARKYAVIQEASKGGHTATIQTLFGYLSPEEKIEAVKARKYTVIQEASKGGHTATIQTLFGYLSPEEKTEAVKANNYAAFWEASTGGHTETIQTLFDYLSPEEKTSAVKANQYAVIWKASTSGHIETIQTLLNYLPAEEKKEAVKVENYMAIQEASSGGHIKTIQNLFDYLSAEEKIEAVKAENYMVIWQASSSGHIETIQTLLNYLPTAEKIEALKAENYVAISAASSRGHIETIQTLLNYLPAAEKIEALKAENYAAIWLASARGHTKMIQTLFDYLSAAEKIEAVKADDYSPIKYASGDAHTETIQYLFDYLSAEEKIEALKADDYQAIWGASVNGYTGTIQVIFDYFSNEEKTKALKISNYMPIAIASRGGYTETIQTLLAYLSPDEKIEAVKADDYAPIRDASKGGHTETIHTLFGYLSPEEKKEAVKTCNYSPIRDASIGGHTETIDSLLGYLSAEEKKHAVSKAIRDELGSINSDSMEYLIQYPIALNYIESHFHRRDSFLRSYVDKKILALQARKEAFEATNPNGLFDVTDNSEVESAIIMLRHLIRRNEAGDLDTIEALISIPSIHNVLHCGYIEREALGTQEAFMGLSTQGNGENQLLRVAQDVGNEGAAFLLLNVPEIRTRAEQANFYQDEEQNDTPGLNLADIARDRESSMRAATEAQKQIAASIQAKYQSIVNEAGGTGVVFDTLKATLANRYQANPATITLDGVTHSLPLTYEALQTFRVDNNLNAQDYQAALIAYYKHPDHTALRYLSKPNHWMAEEASFVNIDEVRNERWSTFEEYIPLIAYLFIAAGDEATPSVDGSSIEDRLTLFIKQLALIGRAHNWDKRNAEGHEYDDLEGDKPSCFSGVLKRLYQAVIGHPLTSVLTDEIVIQAIHELLREHAKQVLATMGSTDFPQLEEAINKKLIMIEDIADEVYSQALDKLIACFNLPKEKIDAFKTSMIEKWGENKATIINTITSTELRLPNGHFNTHLERYFLSADIDRLIEQRKEDMDAACKTITQAFRFFSTQKPSILSALASQTIDNTLHKRRNDTPEDREAFDSALGLVPYKN